MKKNCGFKIAGGIIIGAAFMFLYIFAFKSLWNWIVPAVFAGPTISFLHALGILLLAKMLFGGFSGKTSGGCGSWKNKKQHFWKKRFKEKWQNMSEEEKAELKMKFKSKFGKCWTDDVSNKAPLILLAVAML